MNEGLARVQGIAQAAAGFKGIMDEISQERVKSLRLKADTDATDFIADLEQRLDRGDININNYEAEVSAFNSRMDEYVNNSITYKPAQDLVRNDMAQRKRALGSMITSKIGAQQIAATEFDTLSSIDKLTDGRKKLAALYERRSVIGAQKFSLYVTAAESQARSEEFYKEAIDASGGDLVKAAEWMTNPANLKDKTIGDLGELRRDEAEAAAGMVGAQYEFAKKSFEKEFVDPILEGFSEKGFNQAFYEKARKDVEASPLSATDKEVEDKKLKSARNESEYSKHRNRITQAFGTTINGGVGYEPKLLIDAMEVLKADNGEWFSTPEGAKEKENLLRQAGGYLQNGGKDDSSTLKNFLNNWLIDGQHKGRSPADMYAELIDYNSEVGKIRRDGNIPEFINEIKKQIGYADAVPIKGSARTQEERDAALRDAISNAMHGKSYSLVSKVQQDSVNQRYAGASTFLNQQLSNGSFNNEQDYNNLALEIAKSQKNYLDVFSVKTNIDDPKELQKTVVRAVALQDKESGIPLNNNGELILPADNAKVSRAVASAMQKLVAADIGVKDSDLIFTPNMGMPGLEDITIGENLFVSKDGKTVYKMDVVGGKLVTKQASISSDVKDAGKNYDWEIVKKATSAEDTAKITSAREKLATAQKKYDDENAKAVFNESLQAYGLRMKTLLSNLEAAKKTLSDLTGGE